MIDDGYTTKKDNLDQFAFVRVYQINKAGDYIGDMSSNNVGPTLTHNEMLRISVMQTPDEFTVDQKMGWLTCNGSPNWGCVMRVPTSDKWNVAPLVQQVGAVWAGNVVEVLEQASFVVLYNGVRELVPMSRIRTFDRQNDWGRLDAQLVHNVMAVGRDDIPHKPKGTVMLPIIFKYPSVWVFDRWLK